MRDILESHSVSALKKEISKTNIKGYSKMKKADVVNLMLKHKARFSHIKHAEKKAKVVKPKTTAPKEAPKKKKLIKITKAQKARTEAKATNFLGDIEQKGEVAHRQIKAKSNIGAYMYKEQIRDKPKTPVNEPTDQDFRDWFNEGEKMRIGLSMMRGSAYARTRAEKTQRFAKKWSKIMSMPHSEANRRLQKAMGV